MWVEQRTYLIQPGRTSDYLALYEAKGMGPQSRYLPLMLGYYSSEFGPLNEVVHLWGHRSLDERETNRAAMRADPEFQSYWQEVRILVVRQETRLLRPAPFFADRLAKMFETPSHA